MKTVTIEIPDEVYVHLEKYAEETEQSVPELAADIVTSSLIVLEVQRAEKRTEEEVEEWKEARGFGLNARR